MTLVQIIIPIAYTIIFIAAGLGLLKYDPLHLYGEDKGISFDPKDSPWID